LPAGESGSILNSETFAVRGILEMKSWIKDKEHLFLIAALFLAGLLIFSILRILLVPSDFGTYGHYRSSALVDSRQPAIVYAGRIACLNCHDDKAKELETGKHKIISCEACHDPQAKHAEDPSAQKPQRSEIPKLCLRCHLENVAKPPRFPQINPQDHGEGLPCLQCHHPHHPKIS
jgi:hypothetical protein